LREREKEIKRERGGDGKKEREKGEIDKKRERETRNKYDCCYETSSIQFI
jgi:hypothetical protein